MRQCTWKDCAAEGTHEHTRNDGSVWAVLCDEHHAEVDASAPGSAEVFSPKRALRAWVLASGGAKKLAESM
jgi:hypothetical protein